jgi:flagellar biosynthetic protein FliR
VFSTAASVAGPVLATLLLAHVAMALLNRAVPQLNALMTSFPITIGAGLLTMGIALPVMAGVMVDGFSQLPDAVDAILGSWRLTAGGR